MTFTAPFLIYAVGLLYVLMFLGMSVLRRERLSSQFALEGLGITGVAYAAVRWGGASLHPIYFLLLLYLVTMRARLVVELGNLFARRGHYARAMAFYRLSLRLLPDGQARLVAVINVGATYLRQGAPEKAIEMLGNAKAEVLQKMGPKAAAGCSYNLGMAYRRCGKYPEALRLFHEVEEIHPVSEYAALAARAIKATRDDAGMTVRPADGD